MRLRSRRILASALLLSSVSLPVSMAVADELIKAPAERTVEAASQPTPEGTTTLGPLKLDATASVAEIYSDNIFVTRNDRTSDWITVFDPGASLSLNRSGIDASLKGGINLGRYATHSSEDYTDFFLTATGRFRLDSATTLLGGAQYDWTHESRESPDAVNGLVPTKYRTGDYWIGLLRGFGPVSVRLGATANTYRYDNVVSSAGIIDNHDRNRDEYEIGARVTYRISPRFEPFVQAYWVDREYETALDDLGFQRSSTGYRAAAGLASKVTDTLSGEAYAGLIGQLFDDPRFADIAAPGFGAKLTWHAQSGTNLSTFVDRSVEETTLAGASSFLRTAAGATIEQQVRPDLLADAHFYYSQNAYQDVQRIDHVSDAGAGLRYFFVPRLYVGVDYSFRHRVSNTSLSEFNENRIMFRLGGQAAPAYRSDPDSFTATNDNTGVGGFYAGFLAGTGALVTGLDGPRSSNGSLTADFGDTGWQGGLAAGYGFLLDRTYLGLEASADYGSQMWSHISTGGGRTFSVRKMGSYEFAARLGEVVASGTLLYGRFGVVLTDFKTPYEEDGNFVGTDGTQRGLRIGAGAEFPLTGNLYGRMEYGFTSYADYNVNPKPRGVDNFADAENLTRFGLVYHINDGEDAARHALTADYDGFYAGAQAGLGTLVSDNAGAREDGQFLSVSRGGIGVSGGVFGGYGVMAGPIYLGGEAEAGLSNEDWQIKRDPTGRIYSVTKSYSLGAGLRAGYVFDEGTLVYGRFGVVSTKFRNSYERGMQFVTPDVTKAGIRWGGGVELPFAEDLRLRLDYSWTAYPSYDVDYVTGIDTFKNSESLFRVGILTAL